MTKTVLIADDHAFVAEGMEYAIEAVPELTVIAKVHDGIAAISGIKKHQPDCAVLDLSMPGANGLEVFLEAKKWSPKTKFVIVTGVSAAVLFERLYEAGVHGLFVKNALPETITQGILSVCNGHRVISDDAMAEIKNSQQNKKLSKRESQVLQALASGQNNNAIAEDLGLSPKTVDSHRTSLLRKMKVNSTAALLVKAIQTGLLEV